MSIRARRSRAVSAAEYEELQELVFELVRERLRKAVGKGGMWSISLRKPADTDTVFGEAVAERLAWDVAAHIAPKKARPNAHSAESTEEIFERRMNEEERAEAALAELIAADSINPPEWARYAPPSPETLVASVLPAGPSSVRSRPRRLVA
ncbi:hypothetical protein BH09ACT1_BH09ACT1_18100 [soil metagenome]